MTATQPTYDFLTGGSTAPSPAIKPLGQSMRQSQNIRPSNAEPTVENEDFRAKIKALQYQVDSLKQERDYSNLQHEKALREATLRAEEDARKMQVRKLLTRLRWLLNMDLYYCRRRKAKESYLSKGMKS